MMPISPQWLLLLTCLFNQITLAQPRFSLHIASYSINDFPAIQSFAWASINHKWIMVGGRKDGIHPPQPFASFKPAGQNKAMYIVDPTTKQTTAVNLNELPAFLIEQLSAVNFNFAQVNDDWWITGGYGYSAMVNDHITFPRAIRIHLPTLLQLIQEEKAIHPAFTYWEDDYFAITGGQLLHQHDTFYLAGGQTFTGRYNPHNGGIFAQTYSYGIRRFVVHPNKPSNQQIEKLATWSSFAHLHRRDYNALPTVFPSGEYGFTLFSGVFQPDQDIPFLYPVDINQLGFQPKQAFSQWLNQYHSAKLTLYSRHSQQQDYYFLGGIGQGGWDRNGRWTIDNDVPSTRIIGAITRTTQNPWEEWSIGELPDYLGTGAEFIPTINVPEVSSGIIDGDAITNDTTLLGYMVGGIRSTAPHVFFGPPFAERSIATNQVWKVYAVKCNRSTLKQVPKKK
jgi:hypothetical protein